MPRSLRVLHPGAWYHITARGIERRPIFHDDRDRAHFMSLLADLPERFALKLHAFVLMENHYHLLLALGRPNLSRAIQWLNLSYSVWFNRRHARAGYLFQGRFKSILIEPAAWGLGLSAYIHLNPVRVASLGLGKTDRQQARAGAGSLPAPALVQERLRLLRSYRWSSYPYYIGTSPPWLNCQEVLVLGGGAARERIANYRRYVENQVRQGLPEQPWENLREQALLGGARFAQRVRTSARQQTAPSGRKPRWLAETVRVETVIRAVEKVRGERWADFKDRHGDLGRDLAICLARRATGLTVRELAKAFGLGHPANVTMSIKRLGAKLDRNPDQRTMAAKAAEMLNVAL